MEFKGYTNIPDWMLSLSLDVYETIILAVIYGFSQDGESTFSGSQRYLAGKAKCSIRKVQNVLNSLVEKELIKKIDKNVRGIHLCEYYCTMCKGTAQYSGGMECGAGGMECGADNNIDNNIDIYNTLSNKETASRKFVKPSIDEIRQYCQDKCLSVDPEQFFNFYESKGWMIGKSPMKNWRAAIATWTKRDGNRATRQTSSSHRESVLEHNLKVMDKMFGTSLHQQTYGGQEDEQ